MNISRTERKVAAQLRIQIKEGLVMLVQEGSTDQDHLWVEFYIHEQGGYRSVSFNLPREDLTELCRVLQEFADEVASKPLLEMAR